MEKTNKADSTLPLVEKTYLEEEKRLSVRPEWIEHGLTFASLMKAATNGPLPFDPKFNATHWASGVNMLCREIFFSYCWMNAYAKFYKKLIKPTSRPANVDFHVSYFADNCITRIDSCRDKLALMVWAFYCPFNPEKQVLNYEGIIERLKYPVKFGLKLKNHDAFLNNLERLKGPDFSKVEKYRHYKIHRLEPRIEIYGVQPHHGWSYMIPLIENKEIMRWEKELERQYPNQAHRERIKKGCFIEGVLFERRRIKERFWGFDNIQKHIESCMVKLFKASAGCFRVFTGRSPIKSRL